MRIKGECRTRVRAAWWILAMGLLATVAAAAVAMAGSAHERITIPAQSRGTAVANLQARDERRRRRLRSAWLQPAGRRRGRRPSGLEADRQAQGDDQGLQLRPRAVQARLGRLLRQAASRPRGAVEQGIPRAHRTRAPWSPGAAAARRPSAAGSEHRGSRSAIGPAGARRSPLAASAPANGGSRAEPGRATTLNRRPTRHVNRLRLLSEAPAEAGHTSPSE